MCRAIFPSGFADCSIGQSVQGRVCGVFVPYGRSVCLADFSIGQSVQGRVCGVECAGRACGAFSSILDYSRPAPASPASPASPAAPAAPAAAGARGAPLGQQLSSSSSTARLLAPARSRHRRFAQQKEDHEKAVHHVPNHLASSVVRRCHGRWCSKRIAGCASRPPLTFTLLDRSRRRASRWRCGLRASRRCCP